MVKLRENLKKAEQGAAYWYAKENKNSPTSTSGSGRCWYRRDSTIEELQQALPDDGKTYNFFYCQQYKKIGRKIDQVVVDEIELQPA